MGGQGRAEAAEKVIRSVKPGGMGSWGHGTMGPWDHGAMERHGAGRAEGAERAERAEGAGRAERAGMHWDPLKSAERVQSREARSHGAGWDHGAMGP